MPHPAVKVFLGSLASLYLLGSAWGQVTSTISYTNSSLAPVSGLTFTNISLNKFDTSLGTLTGVVVQMDFATASGEIEATLLSGVATVTGVNTVMTFRQASTNSLGFGTNFFTNSLSVTPALPTALELDDPVRFALSTSPSNLSINFSTNINNTFWSAYSSVDGSGVVTFQFRNTAGLQVTEGDTIPNIDRSAFQNVGRMIVTYSYTTGPEPIPEPSTVAAGAFLTLMAAATYWRRRRSAR